MIIYKFRGNEVEKREKRRTGVRNGGLLFLILLFALISGCGAGSGMKGESCDLPYAPGQGEMPIVVDGTNRNYVLHRQNGYDGKNRLPMVFDFHGGTKTLASKMAAPGVKSLADNRNFVVAFPAAVNGFWNVGMDPDKPDDVKSVILLIDEVSGFVCIDQARVYATGLSGDGRMASRLGCALSDSYCSHRARGRRSIF